MLARYCGSLVSCYHHHKDLYSPLQFRAVPPTMRKLKLSNSSGRSTHRSNFARNLCNFSLLVFSHAIRVLVQVDFIGTISMSITAISSVFHRCRRQIVFHVLLAGLLLEWSMIKFNRMLAVCCSTMKISNLAQFLRLVLQSGFLIAKYKKKYIWGEVISISLLTCTQRKTIFISIYSWIISLRLPIESKHIFTTTQLWCDGSDGTCLRFEIDDKIPF